MGPPTKAKALWDYTETANGDELHFSAGATLCVTQQAGDGWCSGYVASAPAVTGAFPANFVEIMSAGAAPHDGVDTIAPTSARGDLAAWLGAGQVYSWLGFGDEHTGPKTKLKHDSHHMATVKAVFGEALSLDTAEVRRPASHVRRAHSIPHPIVGAALARTMHQGCSII
jgi:hypothetical protein